MVIRKTLLRKLRRDRELTIHMVALKTGVNAATLSLAERGLLKPSDDVKARLSKYFKVDADALFEVAA